MCTAVDLIATLDLIELRQFIGANSGSRPKNPQGFGSNQALPSAFCSPLTATVD